MNESALELHDVTKHFGAIQAVQGISFAVQPGEITALVGDNGAGKSTVVKMIAGTLQPTSGSITIAGEPVSMKGPQDARRHGVETVYQDLALATQQSVWRNLFLGRELRYRWLPIMKANSMRGTAKQLFTDLSVNIPDERVDIAALSGGQRQAVAIARAAHWASRVILMDEPTAALGVAETDRVEALIRRLADRGTAVLLISHNMSQVFRLANQVVVLRRGIHVGTVERSSVTESDVVAMITGAEVPSPQ